MFKTVSKVGTLFASLTFYIVAKICTQKIVKLHPILSQTFYKLTHNFVNKRSNILTELMINYYVVITAQSIKSQYRPIIKLIIQYIYKMYLWKEELFIYWVQIAFISKLKNPFILRQMPCMPLNSILKNPLT